MDGWGKIKDISKYCGLSERTLRGLLKEGLRHSRLKTGTILIKAEWVDQYFESFEVKENEVDAIVTEVLEGCK